MTQIVGFRYFYQEKAAKYGAGLRRFLTFFLTILWVALLTPAMAQTVVGKTVVDGRPVVLLSDQSWAYEDVAGTDGEICGALGVGVSFCGASAVWGPGKDMPAPNLKQFRANARQYAQIFAEEIGTAEGVTMDLMRRAIISNAANGAGLPESDIPVLDMFDTEVAGLPAETVVYAVDFSGTVFVFANALLLTEERTYQFMTYTLGTEFGEDERAFHKSFLDEIRIN